MLSTAYLLLFVSGLYLGYAGYGQELLEPSHALLESLLLPYLDPPVLFNVDQYVRAKYLSKVVDFDFTPKQRERSENYVAEGEAPQFLYEGFHIPDLSESLDDSDLDAGESIANTVRWYPKEISYKTRVTAAKFHQHFLVRREPVVFRNGTMAREENMELLKLWNMTLWQDSAAIKHKAGEDLVDRAWLRSHASTDTSIPNIEKELFKDVLERVESSKHVALLAPTLLNFRLPLNAYWDNITFIEPPLRTLVDDFSIPNFFLSQVLWSTSFLLGNTDVNTQLMNNGLDALVVVVSGRACYNLLSPFASLYMQAGVRYVSEPGTSFNNNDTTSFFSKLPISSIQDGSLFKKSKKAKGRMRVSGEICLNPTDLLYIPAGWWSTLKGTFRAIVFWGGVPNDDAYCFDSKCNNEMH